MKVLVAGDSLMSMRIVDALMHRHQVVCLHPDEGATWKTDNLNAEILQGEITSPQDLSDAGADSCDVCIACSTIDEQNIVAAIAAKKLGAKKTVCVVNGRSFLTTTQGSQEMAQSLGIDHVVRPIEQLSDELIAIVMVPGALELNPVADGRLTLFRFAVDRRSSAVGKNLADLRLPSGTRLVHLRRGDDFIMPRGETTLHAGDKVIAMGEGNRCAKLGALLSGKKKNVREAAVIGGGRVGRAVTRGLIDAGWKVTVIDSDYERCQKIADRTEALVLHGDGTDVEFLEQEHIGEKPVVIAVTESDEKNLLVSLVMKHLGNPRVVTRADRLSNERLFEKVGVDVVRSAKGAAIRSVLRFVDESDSEILAELEHGAACVQEVQVDSNAKEIPVSELAPPAYSVVGAILRGDSTIIPGGQDTIRPGDHLFVFCSREDQEAIFDYFERPTRADSDE